MSNDLDNNRPWYAGVTRYEWLVLLIACLGWVFDVFEGQIFVASMNEAMPSLVPVGTPEGRIAFYNNIALASFLIGGALGGIGFGMLSDYIGRTKTMIITILVYSLFTCVTAFSTEVWHMIVLRFLVAMGVGGEWAVASAMVAEVFPARARAWAGGVFHASSVFGTYLAVGAGAFIVGNPAFGWRWGFAIGAAPALLTLWVRWKLREPDQWIEARRVAKEDRTKKTGNIFDLFRGELLRHTLVGVSLATIGLATFWGAHIYGKDLLRGWAEGEFGSQIEQSKEEVEACIAVALEADSGETIARDDLKKRFATLTDSTKAAALAVLDDQPEAVLREDVQQLAGAVEKQMRRPIKNWEMIGMFLVTTGGGIGLVCFGPICERIGRRRTFVFFHVGGLVAALTLFQVLNHSTPTVYYIALPVFGFLTLGMHAGYAIYFPELFPTRLRGTGGGFCFNGGRILAAPVLFLRGWMRDGLGLSLETTVSILSLLFLAGIFVSLLGPETKGRELPE